MAIFTYLNRIEPYENGLRFASKRYIDFGGGLLADFDFKPFRSCCRPNIHACDDIVDYLSNSASNRDRINTNLGLIIRSFNYPRFWRLDR